MRGWSGRLAVQRKLSAIEVLMAAAHEGVEISYVRGANTRRLARHIRRERKVSGSRLLLLAAHDMYAR